MKCSLIIPAYNAANTIKYTLNSLLNQRVKPDEIILVYATSNDDTFKIIKNYIEVLNIQVIEIFPNGPAKSRNVGIKKSSGDIIIFIDADCILPNDYIEKLLIQYKHESISVSGCKIRGYLPNGLIEYYLSEYGLALPDRDTIFEKPEFLKTFVHTASLTCRKSVFDKVGLFDETLFTGEDHDFSYRVLSSDYTIHYFSGIYLLHKFSNNFLRFIKQTYSFSNIHSYLIKKHFKKNVHIYFRKKKFIINFIKFPLIINLNNITFRIIILSSLLFIHKYFIILFLLWFLKLYISLNRRFSKKYKLSKFNILFLLIIHIFYNFISLIGELTGCRKK
jgi:glycosyltransferase AglI